MSCQGSFSASGTLSCSFRHWVPPSFLSSFFLNFFYLQINLTRDLPTPTLDPRSVLSKRSMSTCHTAIDSRATTLECREGFLKEWGPHSSSSTTVRLKSPRRHDFRHRFVDHPHAAVGPTRFYFHRFSLFIFFMTFFVCLSSPFFLCFRSFLVVFFQNTMLNKLKMMSLLLYFQFSAFIFYF